jgi:3-hydroxybutyryl-CoA dehydrogenase
LVIESVNEDRALKQDIFKMVEAIVRPDCIMATNTSSIPLEQVFEKCTKKDRCLGMHFFYPVKITNFVEVNKTKLTDQFFVEKVKDLLVSVEKKYLELNHEVNLLPTKLYTLFTTEIYNIYEENYLPIEEIDEIVKSNLIIFGVFEIIDSTGVNIIMECLENFMNPRYKGTFTLLYNKCKKLLLEGYSGGTTGKGISAYEIENPRAINEITDIEKNEFKTTEPFNK